MSKPSLKKEITDIYRVRDAADKQALYTYNRAEVHCQNWRRAQLQSAALYQLFGFDLAALRFLDVGCGTGGVLRQFVEWGASPENCIGVELLPERLKVAAMRSPVAMNWHLGELNTLPTDEGFDLVSANTVFSSVLDDQERKRLAAGMWRRVRPGGAVMIFDFRVNNPQNSDVRQVKKKQLEQLFPGKVISYQSLVLLPPLSRKIARFSPTLNAILDLLLPIARTHFLLVVQKMHQGK